MTIHAYLAPSFTSHMLPLCAVVHNRGGAAIYKLPEVVPLSILGQLQPSFKKIKKFIYWQIVPLILPQTNEHTLVYAWLCCN